MSVEAATYINGLDPASPTGASAKNEGDDHIRLLKSSLKATFPNLNGAVNATPAQLNLLVGKSDVATAADIAAAQLSASIPGVNDPANANKFLKGGGLWASIDQRGAPSLDKGNSGTTAQVIDYAAGEGQTITATGTHTLTTTGFPAGRFAGILVRMVNYGAYAPTTTGITWIKSDGSTTTNFASSGISLNATGPSFVALFSYGDGIVYGRAA